MDTLTALTKLTKLYLADCGIGSIDTPFMSLELERISLQGNNLKDIDCLKNLTVLSLVDLSENKLQRIDVLSKSSETLVLLDLRNNRLAYDDLHILPAMKSLVHLYLQDMVTLRNLDDIAPLTNLQTLVINDTYLKSIEGISAQTKLTHLDLSDNLIEDITPLKDMTFPQSMLLDLSGNRITDMSAVPRSAYYYLGLHGNRIAYAENALKDITGSYITIDYDDTLTSCKADGQFAWPIVVDTPADKQLALKNVLGQYILYATDETVDSILIKEGYKPK